MSTEPKISVDKDGTQYWFQNGVLHRTDGPAAIWPDGTEYWYQNGQRHREDGPAVIRPDGTQRWCLNGKSYDFTDWLTARGSDATINT